MNKIEYLIGKVFGYGWECPKCDSDNTETYLFERQQFCLDCGHDFKLNKKLVNDMLKDYNA